MIQCNKTGWWIWLLITLVGCQKSEDVVEIDKEEPDPEVLFDLLPGWDVFSPNGVGYRYGPSIIINDDESVDVWSSADGGSYIYPNGESEAVLLTPGNALGQKFDAGFDFSGLKLVIPTWDATNSGARFRLFVWQQDYQTTVASTPVVQTNFTNVTNQEVEVILPQIAAAGTYLWVMDEPIGIIGLWKVHDDQENLEPYLSGFVTSGAFRAGIFQSSDEEFNYWDQVALRRSSNGGRGWSPEVMSLLPTRFSRDQLSACDPGLARWGGYYYCAYTSTEDHRGTDGNVFVARSLAPEGPWEKWDGSGWGGNPQPIVVYTDSPDAYGAGEPCLVVKDDVVFLYYTWIGDPAALYTTRLSTADAGDPLWPGNLTHRGIAMDKSDLKGVDHCDVKYKVDDEMFYAIHLVERLSPDCAIMVWESADGIHFTRKGIIESDFLQPYAHNAGWSGNGLGHIESGVQQYISYAYGPDWGQWKTAWHPIRF